MYISFYKLLILIKIIIKKMFKQIFSRIPFISLNARNFANYPTANPKKLKTRYPDFEPYYHALGVSKDPALSMIPKQPWEYDDIYPLRMPEIKTRILFVLSKYEQIALSEQFNWKGDLEKDFGLDSLDRIAIITSIEDEFHTVFEDNVFDNMKSFDDVAQFIGTLHDAY